MGDKKKLFRPRQSRQLKRRITLILGVGLVLYCLVFVTRSPPSKSARYSTSISSSRRPLPPELLNNLSLDEEQCNAAFPGLTKEIEDTVAEGPFQVKQTGDLGPLQGRIKDGQVGGLYPLLVFGMCLTAHLAGQIYIIHAQRKSDLSREMVNVSSLLP